MPDQRDAPFRPVLQDHRPPSPAFNPWLVLIPTFFGGSVAATIGTVALAQRLGLPRRAQAAMVAVGGLGLLVAGVLLHQLDVSPAAGNRLAGFAAFAVQLGFLLGPYRRWQATGQESATFLHTGLTALVIGLASNFLLVLVVRGLPGGVA